MAHHPEGTQVPDADSTANDTVRDVVGSKLDTVSSESLSGRAHSVEEHMHTASKCYPTLADGVTITAEAADWGVGGALVEIVPASTITSIFDIHYVNIEDISAARTYELILYYGAGDTECARFRFTKSAGLDPVLDRGIQTDKIPANSRIRARLASAGAVADTADISLQYHEYT
jgi:hypothetical protein